jgi:nucleoside transporter
VPIGSILDANHLHFIKPYAFAAYGTAAFISPLMFGAMADRHVSPARVLRWLAFSAAFTTALIGLAIQLDWNGWLILGLIQVFYLSYAPMFSISTALVLARLANAKKEFGPIRSLGTIGWVAGALLVGLLGLDRSASASCLEVALWVLVGTFTYFLPQLEIPRSAENLTWHERLGLDALTLLKNRDTRVVFITITLFSIPIAAFYPYAPTHIHDLGLRHTSAWMSLAQLTEIFGMFGIGWLLLNWRLKWIFACGLAIGMVRFGLSALDTREALLLGVALHGASFVFVYITAQIYLEQYVESAWRARAQALLSLMNNGVGSLIGYLVTGWWFDACTVGGETHWPKFWGAISAGTALVLIYFLYAYRENETPILVTASLGPKAGQVSAGDLIP